MAGRATAINRQTRERRGLIASPAESIPKREDIDCSLDRGAVQHCRRSGIPGPGRAGFPYRRKRKIRSERGRSPINESICLKESINHALVWISLKGGGQRRKAKQESFRAERDSLREGSLMVGTSEESFGKGKGGVRKKKKKKTGGSFRKGFSIAPEDSSIN